MDLERLIIREKIAVTLDENSVDIVSLINYIPFTKSGYRLINESLEINNLKATSWIYSLPPVPFPVFELEDSESKQLLTAINLEWDSPRFEMDISIKINAGSWQKIAAYSLINFSPYPYREYSIGNHILGNNSILGVQIIEVGYGKLVNQDKVTIIGDLIREVTIEKSVDNASKIANNITTIAGTIVNSNANRKGLTIFNSSDKSIFVDTVPDVSTTAYMLNLEPGDYYEAPIPIYTGEYYALVAAGNAAIDIREFV